MQEKSTNMIVGAVIGLVLIVGGVWFFTMRDDKTEKKNPTESSQTQTNATEEAAPTQNIVEIASANSDFSTLVDLVKTAGLVETLSGTGPFTVFAPTNEAFAKLPTETVEALKADPAKLKDVLTYHVVSGSVDSTAVMGLDSATSVQGKDIAITKNGGVVTLNGTSAVTKTDIKATNGIIHVIDTVILPPSN